ncbi:fimbria/pilus periplasmic chaperone [Hafnia paralvei]|uniref:fimbria/pilus periplasmic chaperone n=1 Tax=Hafnia paralvei TaxID=546367 RepID=UPI00300CC044
MHSRSMRLTKNALNGFFIGACLAQPAIAEDGITIQGTRIVYLQDAKQASLSVSNTSITDSVLGQSWVENASGHKTTDFVVTPPLYLSGPKDENTLRLIHTGGPLLTDHGTP